jgi:DNA-binding NtrC family response regulator
MASPAQPILFHGDERQFAEAVAALTYTNPFGEERVALEKRALGGAFRAGQPYWSLDVEGDGRNPNVVAIGERVEALAAAVRGRILGLIHEGRVPGVVELGWYEDLVLYLLYDRHHADFLSLVRHPGDRYERVGFYRRFEASFGRFLRIEGLSLPGDWSAAHIFACFFQVRRAFHYIYESIIGRSQVSARLRENVWESIFSRDMRRFRRALYDRMGDLTTLIVGPTGTGKEVVAHAIGRARYIPFDEVTGRFSAGFHDAVRSLNLSALSPSLIESELFGHRKGAFTGAIEDREGWLEGCGRYGTVFLDEIGEVDATIQIKLLRVLQTRRLQRLGESRARAFEGKVVAATNRDLAAEIAKGRFREDLYYRLCADQIVTPSLREQVAGNPEELRHMIRYVAQRVAGDDEADDVSAETLGFVERELGTDYSWPGNFRELEQCVRNVIVRGAYRPATPARAERSLAELIEGGEISADELVARYCRHLHDRFGNYQDVARRTGLDWRTVKAKVTGKG